MREKAEQWRFNHRLSKHEMARKIGVSRQTYYRFVAGKIDTMRPAAMQRLEAVLEEGIEPAFAPAWLLAREDKKTNFKPIRRRIDAFASVIHRYGDKDEEEEHLEETYHCLMDLEELRKRVDTLDAELDTLRRDLDLFEGKIEHMYYEA